MSFGVLDAQETENGFAVTFITESGLYPLEGTREELSRLAAVMRQVSAIAPLHDGRRVWLEEVAVGNAVVKLGLGPAQRARMRIIRH